MEERFWPQGEQREERDYQRRSQFIVTFSFVYGKFIPMGTVFHLKGLD